MNVLKISNLGINFGGLRAVDNFNLEINEGELVGLIGPNGAGKTTVFNMLTGVYAPTDGILELGGVKYNGKTTYQIANMGIARTFQNIRLFKNCTVLDNVKVAMHDTYRYSVIEAVLRLPKYYRLEKQMDEKAVELLKIFSLEDYAETKASNLPYGKQRELEIVRALATNPKLLLLDEPAAGMNPNETKELMDTIKKVRDEFKIAILLIEHDMKLVKGICEKITVLNYGCVLAEGDVETVLSNKSVISAYLGD